MQPFLIIPNEDDNHSVDYTYNANQENFDANYNVPNVPVYSQELFPKYEEDRYGILSLFTSICFPNMRKIDMEFLVYSLHQSSNLMKVSVQLIFGQKKIPAALWKVRDMIWKEITCGLSKVSFL